MTKDQKKAYIATGAVAAATIGVSMLLTGCTTSKAIVSEFDSNGNVTKVTETHDSVVKELIVSTKDKTVVVWKSGWAAGISASTATVEQPTPTVKMFVGKTDEGMISAHKDQKTFENIDKIIKATKYDLEVSKDGVKSNSAKEN